MNEYFKQDLPYYFDTNAIYYFCGENASKWDLEEFRKDFCSAKYKIVPSCVMQEIIVKFRNDTNKLINIINCLSANHFLISPSSYDYLDDKFFKDLETDFDKTVNDVLLKKIDNESRLIYLIVFSVSMVYVSCLSEYFGFKDSDNFSQNFFYDSIKDNENSYFEDIKIKLTNAYRIDDTERVIKSVYNDYLFSFCSKAHKYGFDLKNKEMKTTGDYTVDTEAKKIMKNKNNFYLYLNKFIKNYPETLKLALYAIPSFFVSKNFSEEQGLFMKLKLNKWLAGKTKLEKNDIYDCFYIQCFSNASRDNFNNYMKSSIKKEDIRLISFDSRTREIIGLLSNDSKQLVEYYRK